MLQMAEKGLPVRLMAGHYDFRADTEADFLRGCYSGLRMFQSRDEFERGLRAEGLAHGTGPRAEARGGGPPEQDLPLSQENPSGQFEDEIDDPMDNADQEEKLAIKEKAIQKVGQMEDVDLELSIPEADLSDGWHSLSPNPIERPQRAAVRTPSPVPAWRPAIGRGALRGFQRWRDERRQRVEQDRPRPTDDRPRSDGLCYDCGRDGHFARNCPHPRHPLGPPCFECLRRGHLRADCPVLAERREGYRRRDERRQQRDAEAREYVISIARGRARIARQLSPPPVGRRR